MRETCPFLIVKRVISFFLCSWHICPEANGKTLWGLMGETHQWRWKWTSIFLVYKHRVIQVSALKGKKHLDLWEHVPCVRVALRMGQFSLGELCQEVIQSSQACFSLAHTCAWRYGINNVNRGSSNGWPTSNFETFVSDFETRSSHGIWADLRCSMNDMRLLIDDQNGCMYLRYLNVFIWGRAWVGIWRWWWVVICCIGWLSGGLLCFDNRQRFDIWILGVSGHLEALKVLFCDGRWGKRRFRKGLSGTSCLWSQWSPSRADLDENVTLKKKTWPNIITGIKLDRLFVMSLFGSLLNVQIELSCCSQHGRLHTVRW